MKIVLSHRNLLFEGLGGGISRVYNELGAALSELGCEVTLITGQKPFKASWAKVISLNELDKNNYRHKLSEFLRTYDFDVIECSSLDAEASEYIKLPNHKPLVVRADVSSQDFNGWPDEEESRLMQEADAIIAISYAVQKYFKDNSNIDIPHVIWDGVDTNKFPFSKPTGNKAVIWIGRATHAKGLDRLPHVLHTLKDYHFNIMMGQNQPEKSFSQSNVTLHQNLDQDQLLTVFQQSSFVLFTARFEPFGLAALEGMSAGVAPIVPADSGGLNEFVIHNYNGLVYDSIDELPNLLSNVDFNLLTTNGRKTALDMSSRRCALESLAVYSQLL